MVGPRSSFLEKSAKYLRSAAESAAGVPARLETTGKSFKSADLQPDHSIPNSGARLAQHSDSGNQLTRGETVPLSSQQTILIVEDDVPLRTIWRTAFRFEGFDVMEAGDGVEALRAIESHPPDVVVLDLGLPCLDGMSVQQEIAAHAATHHIAVVIATASTDDFSNLEVPCVLRKPVSLTALVRAVHRCMDARPVLNP